MTIKYVETKLNRLVEKKRISCHVSTGHSFNFKFVLMQMDNLFALECLEEICCIAVIPFLVIGYCTRPLESRPLVY
jgi:hypothetical protein